MNYLSEKRSLKFLCIIATMLIISILLQIWYTTPVYAGESDIVTKSYDVDVRVSKDKVFTVDETITMDFGNNNRHGIYRYIPYSKGESKIKDAKSTTHKFETRSENSNVIIKLGSADKYLSGVHEFKISYKIIGYEDRNAEQDTLNLDLIPTEWKYPIQNFNVKLHMPEKWNTSDMALYHGSYGSTQDIVKDPIENVSYKINEDGKEIEISGVNVNWGSHSGLTIASILKENYFTGEASTKYLLYVVPALYLLVLLLSIIIFMKWGRDPVIPVTVEFYPPDNITPCEAGAIMDGKVSDKHVRSLLIYLAQKGYLRIEEREDDRIWLQKLKTPDSSEPNHVLLMFNGIFHKKDEGVFTDEMPDRLYTNEELIKTNIYQSCLKSVWDKKSRYLRRIMTGILLLVILGTSVLVHTTLEAEGFIVAMCIFTLIYLMAMMLSGRIIVRGLNKSRVRYFFYRILPTVLTFASSLFLGAGFTSALYRAGNVNIQGYRLADIGGICIFATLFIGHFIIVNIVTPNKKKLKLIGRIKGFREFIKVAEIERINMLVHENPNYFFDVLPYAYVFGLTKEWISLVEKIKVEEPKWFSSYNMNENSLLSAWYLNRAMNYSMDSFQDGLDDIISEVMKSQDTGGSSDFGSFGGGDGGGGGFSGGGFGGGGGGSW